MSEQGHMRKWVAAEVRHGYDQVIRDDQNNPICSLLLVGWDKKSQREHARLIAAAPDLLMALLWLVGLAEERPADSNEQIILALAAARAAIAKATVQP